MPHTWTPYPTLDTTGLVTSVKYAPGDTQPRVLSASGYNYTGAQTTPLFPRHKTSKKHRANLPTGTARILATATRTEQGDQTATLNSTSTSAQAQKHTASYRGGIDPPWETTSRTHHPQASLQRITSLHLRHPSPPAPARPGAPPTHQSKLWALGPMGPLSHPLRLSA